MLHAGIHVHTCHNRKVMYIMCACCARKDQLVVV